MHSVNSKSLKRIAPWGIGSAVICHVAGLRLAAAHLRARATEARIAVETNAELPSDAHQGVAVMGQACAIAGFLFLLSALPGIVRAWSDREYSFGTCLLIGAGVYGILLMIQI